MNIKTEIEIFTPPDNVSHVEIASVHFDQWILTIGVRYYGGKDDDIIGMAHVVFDQPEGFRMLDEGAMLNFPWQELSETRAYVHIVYSGGWFDMESNAGNLHLPDTAKEYIVKTSNECVSVIAYSEPKLIMVKP